MKPLIVRLNHKSAKIHGGHKKHKEDNYLGVKEIFLNFVSFVSFVVKISNEKT